MSHFHLMSVYAHPDDEAFSLAGSFARATRASHAVAVVCATRGEQGQIAPGVLATPETLGEVREGELRRACQTVGVNDVRFLDYRDGHLAEADPDEATERIVRQIRQFRPDVVVTFPANGGYGHVDHIAIHHLTRAALVAAADSARYPQQGLMPHRVRKVYYSALPREWMSEIRQQAAQAGQEFTPGGDQATIPIEEMGTPRADITTQVTLTDAEYTLKEQALRAHASQMPADGPLLSGDSGQMRSLLGTETFMLVPPPLSDRIYPTPEESLFDNL